MRIRLDLTSIPPAITLEDPDDFKSLKVTARAAEHTYLTRAALAELAGDRARDPDWNEQLDGMLGYAKEKGWVREDGAVRAHVEWLE